MFDIFVNTSLHGGKWKRATCGVVYNSRELFGKDFVYENDSETQTHAEMVLLPRMIDAIRSVYGEQQSEEVTLSVKVFLNNSPCGRCSSRILDFLKRIAVELDLAVSLEIVFSSIYKIWRPSCENCSHRKIDPNTDSDHEYNVGGLRRLMDGGVKLRPFLEEDWRQLASSLFPQDEEKAEDLARDAIRRRRREGNSKGEIEDDNMWKDFQYYFGGDGMQNTCSNKQQAPPPPPLSSAPPTHIHARARAHAHTHTHTNTQTRTHTHTCMHARTRTHARTHIHMKV